MARVAIKSVGRDVVAQIQRRTRARAGCPPSCFRGLPPFRRQVGRGVGRGCDPDMPGMPGRARAAQRGRVPAIRRPRQPVGDVVDIGERAGWAGKGHQGHPGVEDQVIEVHGTAL